MCSGCADRSWRSAARLFGLLALLLGLTACSDDPASPEAQIRALVDQFEAAMEAGDFQDAAEVLDERYRDRHHPDRRSAKATLFAYTRRHENLHVFTRWHSLDVAPGGERATAVVDVAMTARPANNPEELAGLRADLYRFTLDLRWNSQQEAWRIRTAEWQRAQIPSLF